MKKKRPSLYRETSSGYKAFFKKRGGTEPSFWQRQQRKQKGSK
jgi:hypothetical protein